MVKALSTFTDSKMVEESAMLSIIYLGRDEENALRLTEQGACEIVLKAMMEFQNDNDAQFRG